jgi:hypothetical protein
MLEFLVVDPDLGSDDFFYPESGMENLIPSSTSRIHIVDFSIKFLQKSHQKFSPKLTGHPCEKV